MQVGSVQETKQSCASEGALCCWHLGAGQTWQRAEPLCGWTQSCCCCSSCSSIAQGPSALVSPGSPRGIARAAAVVAGSHIPILCLQPQEPTGASGRPAPLQVTQPCCHPQVCEQPQQHHCLESSTPGSCS